MARDLATVLLHGSAFTKAGEVCCVSELTWTLLLLAHHIHHGRSSGEVRSRKGPCEIRSPAHLMIITNESVKFQASS